jgi:hypothetical protein
MEHRMLRLIKPPRRSIRCEMSLHTRVIEITSE